jgi:hypothetical protein
MIMLRFFAQQFLQSNNLPNLPKTSADSTSISHLLTLLFTVVGALALLMMVIAGLRYILAQGEPQKMTEIRRQIIYIAIGLVLAASADVIVTFVLNKAG